MIKYRYIMFLLLLLSFCANSENYFHKISDDVKIEYQQDGLVKIYSTDNDQQNLYFSLKLDSLSSGKKQSDLDVPLSVSQVGDSVVYNWNSSISEQWELIDNIVVRKLTIKKKPNFNTKSNNLTIHSFFKTDLGYIAAGMSYPYTFSRDIMDHESLNNLRIDETSYYIIDANCKQLIVDKDFDYKNHKLDYNLDTKNIKYPITLTQEIKINFNDPLDFSWLKYDREVAVNDNNLIISEHYQNSVKVYEKKNNEWHYLQTLLPETLNGMDFKGVFGSKLALSGNTLAITFYDDKENFVYIFKKSMDLWEQQTKISSPDPNYLPYFNSFGNSIDLFEDKLVIADLNVPVGNKPRKNIYYKNDKNWDSEGAVYIFKETNNVWRHTDTISPERFNIGFGKSVAVDNDLLIIGGGHTSRNDNEGYYGKLYIYQFENDKWQKETVINITDLVKKYAYYDSSFATSIDVSNNTIVVGYPLSNFNGTRGSSNNKFRDNLFNIESNKEQYGQVYVFKKKGNKWKKQARIQAPKPLQLDYFGSSVKIANNTIIIGAPGDSNQSPGINSDNDNCQLPSSGAVYVYEKKWTGWRQSAYIKSNNPDKLEQLGSQIDSDGKTIIVNSNDIHIFNKTDESWKKVKHIKTLPFKRSK